MRSERNGWLVIRRTTTLHPSRMKQLSCKCTMLSLQLKKLHAIGYKPVLLLGKETKKKENKCEILTPRCTLSTYAQDYLQKIGSFYEYLCEGWNQNSSGNDDQLITLHLTPCDSLENTSSREEVRTTQVEETRNMQVEQATIMEGQAEQMSITEGQAERATIMEGQAEQISTTVGQVEQMSITEGQAEQMSTIEGQGTHSRW
ncbi:uncharacterized protein LOC131543345 isoform X2 [Onychostoma macrolepis]|uniref:uncharacterized protein LOC131543345 isoform X2 n=1 Tax=Onychostoma macrolepis TaxID=369639 RepID=UPI00272B67C7|nr:uncharacterized protein LOC131543345 isoform X2 [Onychostoma macrolepis]